MGYLIDFDDDVFISYAQNDDDFPPSEQSGWVTRFYRDLQAELRIYLGVDVSCWRHSDMISNEDFSKSLIRLKRTAIFIAVLSPYYLQREWIQLELNAFVEKGENTTSRIFGVEKSPVDHSTLPPPLQLIRSYQFHQPDPTEPTQTMQLGALLDGEGLYVQQLKKLAEDVANLLRSMHPLLFISHSRKDNVYAIAFKEWLGANGWPADEVFLDLADIAAGERWQGALIRASARAICVIFLASPDSLTSEECLAEFRLAESLGKEIIVVLLRNLRIGDLRLKILGERHFFEVSAAPLRHVATVAYRDKSEEVRFNEEALAGIRQALHELWGDSNLWRRQHTELAEAARRWALAGRPRGLLLRSRALEAAERLVELSSTALEATEEIRSFIAESQTARPLVAVHRFSVLAQLVRERCAPSIARVRRVVAPLARLSPATTTGWSFIAHSLGRMGNANSSRPRVVSGAATVAAIVLVLAPVFAALLMKSRLEHGSRLLADPLLRGVSRAHTTETTSISFGPAIQAAGSSLRAGTADSLQSVVTSSYDGTIKFWGLDSGDILRTVFVSVSPSAGDQQSNAAPLAFAFGRDNRIVAITNDGPAKEGQYGKLQLIGPEMTAQSTAPC